MRIQTRSALWKRAVLRFIVLIIAGLLVLAAFLSAGATPPEIPFFERTWERTDKPVTDLTVSRTWMWGPEAFTNLIAEPYVESANQQRGVQYFDKSRMEDNSDRASAPWDVTNGLLVVELMTGNLQLGDATFEKHQSANVNVGGDPDDLTGPTYATMAMVRNLPPLADGQTIGWTIDRDGNIGAAPSDIASLGVTATHRVTVPTIDHQVASVFWTFMNSSGLVWQDGQLTTDKLFLNPFYATGLPVTEAYWANIKVAGNYKWVLLQCFERRCLTYNPDNSTGWKVEAGNVGQHYHYWRYVQIPGEGTPTPTATVPGATATATVPPGATATSTPNIPNFAFAGPFGEPWDPTTLMNSPTDLAVDASGNIYVADGGNNRIQKYKSNGVFIRQWGKQGSANGEFKDPRGIAISQQGNVYVTDRGNARVQIFDGDGNWLETVSYIDTGGAILHSFILPGDIDVGGGFVWVADRGQQQLMAFPVNNSTGIGIMPGTSNLTDPTGVAFDPHKNQVYVTDSAPGVSNIKIYDTQGNYLTTWGPPGVQLLEGVSVDSSGNIWVIDHQTGQVWEAPTGGNWTLKFGSNGINPGEFNGPLSIVAELAGIFVVDSGNNRIQLLYEHGLARDLWSDNRRERYAFPAGISRCGSLMDYLCVVDTGLSRIQQTSQTGDFWLEWGAGTTVPVGWPALFLPLDIAVDGDGNMYIADSANSRIVKYGVWAGYDREWGQLGANSGQFNLPFSLAVDEANNVYVADTLNHRIQKFKSGGQFIQEWGTEGNVLGAFRFPSGIAITGNYVFVVDQGNHRVQRFDLDGNYTGVWWGGFGSATGMFNTPADIAIDPSGYVYVADSLNHRVQAFTQDGQFVQSWGSGPGNSPVQFNTPIDIAFNAAGTVMWVTDRENHRIQVLAVP